jgi:hypothetical protein
MGDIAAPAAQSGPPTDTTVLQGAETPAPGGDTASPAPVPYERFQEMNRKYSETRQALEQRLQAQQAQYEALQQQVQQGPSEEAVRQHLANMFAPPAAQDEFVDPLEKEVTGIREMMATIQAENARMAADLQATRAENYRQAVLEPMLNSAKQEFPHADDNRVVAILTADLQRNPRPPTREDFRKACETSQKEEFQRAEAIMRARYPNHQLPSMQPRPPLGGLMGPGNPGTAADVDVSKLSMHDIINGTL